ncbi:MAG: Mur ligase family protein [Oscillospiraceae bacterium]|nr:Mur ligase family protein [Oscillospiraceae bacterium]
MRNKRIAVIGLGVSNTPLIKYIAALGANVTVFDKADEIRLSRFINELKGFDVKYSLGPDYLDRLSGFDIVFKTPIVRFDIPELLSEKARGAQITSEMEAFLDLCPAMVFGVTGSDGKTTTTTLIYEMLKTDGYNCWLGGNIGIPLFDKLDLIKPDDAVVLELSSFQLQTIRKSTAVAVVTNLSPNHLDVHKSYQEYIDSKKNIFLHQSKTGLCVLNYDCEASTALTPEIKGGLSLFSLTGDISHIDCDSCAYVKDGVIFYCGRSSKKVMNAASNTSGANGGHFGRGGAWSENCISGEHGSSRSGNYDGGNSNGDSGGGNSGPIPEALMEVGEIRLRGFHNVANYLAAICAVKAYVRDSSIRKVAASFPGVEHRLEQFRSIGGVNFYNDSIATSPSRTIACLNSFDERIILIAGGKDKGLDYSVLGKYLAEKVKVLVLCGSTSRKIKDALLSYCAKTGIDCTIPIMECNNLADAVTKAWENASGNDCVVLSPAGTSFDQFLNFEERGNTFKKLVNEIYP